MELVISLGEKGKITNHQIRYTINTSTSDIFSISEWNIINGKKIIGYNWGYIDNPPNPLFAPIHLDIYFGTNEDRIYFMLSYPEMPVNKN